MDSVRFCQLAPLLGAYSGAVAARVHQDRSEDSPGTAVAPVVTSGLQVPAGAHEIPSTQAAVRLSPMSDLFSFATSGG